MLLAYKLRKTKWILKDHLKMNGELVITDCDTSFGKDGSIEKETIW